MQKVPGKLIGLGLLIIICSLIIGWVGFPYFMRSRIIQRVQINEASPIFERWKDVPLEIFMSFYIFNVTNPDDFNGENDVKPILQELGPYVYQEKRVKEDIEFNEDGTRVKYRDIIRFYLREDLSNGSVDDIVNVVNLPFISAVVKMSNYLVGPANTLSKELWNKGYRLVRKDVRVGDLLFDGMDVQDLKDKLWLGVPPEISDGKFGIKRLNNKTDNALFEVKTGKDSHENFGQIFKLNEHEKLPFWDDDTPCNFINGSDGALFPPFINKEKLYPIYNLDLCRTIYLGYINESSFKGIPSYRFSPLEENFDDPRTYEPNRCFCKNPGVNFENCVKKGAIPLDGCKDGAPVIMSIPHFMGGSTDYLNMSIGLSPDPYKHKAYIELEPNSGMLLNARKRIQINVELKRIGGVSNFKKLKQRVFPLLWVEERVSIDDKTANGLYARLLTPLDIVNYGKWVLPAVGVLLLIIGTSMFAFNKRRYILVPRISDTNTNNTNNSNSKNKPYIIENEKETEKETRT